jgi:isocitrate dehydrogenase
MYEKLLPPNTGTCITFQKGKPIVPDNPNYSLHSWRWHRCRYLACGSSSIRGCKQSIWGQKIEWFKIYAGDEACDLYGTYQYLPQDTLTAIAEDGIAIKGSLTTPIGGGIRSLNVARRQIFPRLTTYNKLYYAK